MDLTWDEGWSERPDWCGSPVVAPLGVQQGSVRPYISQSSSRSRRAEVLPATLHGRLARPLPTTVHRHTARLWSIVWHPLCGIQWELGGKTAAECLMKENPDTVDISGQRWIFHFWFSLSYSELLKTHNCMWFVRYNKYTHFSLLGFFFQEIDLKHKASLSVYIYIYSFYIYCIYVYEHYKNTSAVLVIQCTYPIILSHNKWEYL